MAAEMKITAVVTVFGAIALAVGFSMPALTEGGNEGRDSAAFKAVVKKEHSHCEAHLDGVDCGCFAQKAGYLQTEGTSNTKGGRSMAPQDLARGQASSSCRTSR